MTTNDRLAAKVRAVNTANRVAAELYDRLEPEFLPYKGSKVVNKDGSLVNKLAKRVEPIIDSFRNDVHHIYKYSVGDYNVMYVVKTCESYEGYSCVYHETSVYIVSIRNGILIDFYRRPELRSDYDAAEIQSAKSRYDVAKRAADAIIAPYHSFESY